MLLDVVLPLSLAFIMFSLGLGLTCADFGRVLTLPKPVFAGIALQVCLVPIVAYLLLQVFVLPPALAFGVMILAFCPGGVTSNILTKLAGGNVALSVTLTAVVSLLSVLTVPLLTVWAAQAFLGADAPRIDVTSIAIAMFLITAVPVILGLLLRHFGPGLAAILDRPVSILATVLFVIIVLAALATNWSLFVGNIAQLGPLLVVMNILLLVAGVLAARLLGLTGPDGIGISIELGVQNASLGITVAALVAQTASLSEYAVPAGVYGITMYFVSLPMIYLLKRVF